MTKEDHNRKLIVYEFINTKGALDMKKLSESEWMVMKVLWEHPHITLKEITALLNDSEWSYSTIRTLVSRLVKKDAVAADKTIGNFKYYPIAEESECKQQEAKKFLSRVFDGSISMMVSTLVMDSNLSEDEQKELMDIIDKIDGE